MSNELVLLICMVVYEESLKVVKTLDTKEEAFFALVGVLAFMNIFYVCRL